MKKMGVLVVLMVLGGLVWGQQQTAPPSPTNPVPLGVAIKIRNLQWREAKLIFSLQQAQAIQAQAQKTIAEGASQVTALNKEIAEEVGAAAAEAHLDPTKWVLDVDKMVFIPAPTASTTTSSSAAEKKVVPKVRNKKNGAKKEKP